MPICDRRGSSGDSDSAEAEAQMHAAGEGCRHGDGGGLAAVAVSYEINHW